MAVDFAQGMVQTAVHGWFCDTCTRKIRYFTRRQREQWRAGERIECRGLVIGRLVCKGQIVHAEAARTP